MQPDRGSAVPKFGEWDEKDPSTGEGFTDIFEKVREEKQSGTSNAPIMTSEADYIKRYQQRKYESTVSLLTQKKWSDVWSKTILFYTLLQIYLNEKIVHMPIAT